MCDIETICRLCGTPDGIKVKIFDPRMLYVYTIQELLPVMVDERDPWSKLICHRCAYKLEDFHHFRELCVKTDSYLKTRVSWEPPVSLQHIPAEPQNEQIKEEQIEQEEEGGPSSAPPPLSPQFRHEIQDELSSELPPLLPVTAPSTCTQVHANNLQQMFAITQATPPASDLLADTVFVNSDLVNSYEAEEPPVADSDSTTYDRDMGVPDSGVSEKMEVDAKSETPRTGSRKRKNISNGIQVSKKKKMPSKHRSRSCHTNKINSVKSVCSSVNSEDCSTNGTKSNRIMVPECYVKTKAANINDNVLHPKSHAKTDTLKKELKRKPGPKSKVGSRDDDSENDESDVIFVLHKPANSVMDVIDITNVSDSPDEEVDESDPDEGLLSHALITRIPGMCSVFTCSYCEGTFTSKRCVIRHACKGKKFNSLSPEEQVPGGKTSEVKTSGKETCKNIVPEAMASENRPSEKEASDNMVPGNEDGISRRSSYESTLSSSSASFSELPGIRHLGQGAATVGKDHSNQDTVSADCGPYRCDICGFTFSRLVTLMSHKNRHLYCMNDDDDDDDDDDYYRCVRKKKKPVA